MKALYVTSLQRFGGKTAVCLALGRRLKKEKRKISYLKLLSTQSWEMVPGAEVDEDASFVRRVLELEDPPKDMVGVLLTPSLLQDVLRGESDRDLLAEIKTACERITPEKEVVLLEGGASLREGFSVGLGTPEVAEMLDAFVLAVVWFRDEMSLVDDCLVAQLRLPKRLMGVIINGVPEQGMEFVTQTAVPYLEKQGIAVLGVLPRRENLRAISVDEMVQVLGAEFLVMPEKEEVLVQHLLVGAMSAEQALPRMRRIAGSKALVTGGDRADLQLVALETATACLILTGHLRPQPEVIRRAEEVGVPVLLVRQNTMETINAIEQVFGKTRLGQREKLEQFERLMAEHFDFDRFYKQLGL